MTSYVKCGTGWVYDQSELVRTVSTEVSDNTGNMTSYVKCGTGWVYDQSELVRTVSTEVSDNTPANNT